MVNGGRQESLREHNLSVISRLVFAEPVPLSRAELAERTGMARSTVSRLVDDLLAGGLLREGAPVSGGGRGRPAVPLTPASGTFVGLGLEGNVDFLAARVVDLTGAVLAERIVEGDFRGSDAARTLCQVGDLGRETLSALQGFGLRLVGTVLALPGLIAPTDYRLLLAPNLGWRDQPTTSALGDLTPLGGTVQVVNEAKAAAVASVTSPTEPGHDGTFLYVSGEIGIGAAVVVDGSVEAGSHGWGGEIGHLTIEPEGPPCGCGARGCLEQYAGKVALETAAGVDVRSGSRALVEACAVTGERGASARAGVERAAWALGIALSAAVNLLDIQHVVLGGTFADLAPRLIPGIEAQLHHRVLSREWSTVVLSGATTGTAPATTGAAMTALQSVIANPAAYVGEGLP